MTHQGFSTTNMKPNTSKNMSTIHNRNKNNSYMNGSNAEFDSYLESYHDKYLYDLLHRYERTLLGSTALADSIQDEHLFIDINIQFNYPMEIQVLSSEPGRPSEPTSQQYFMVSRLSFQPQTLQLLRSQHMSSFSGFGIEFESTNRIKVLQLFCR